MTLHPEFVKKAQEELDRVVGRERLPDFSDMPCLPYIAALVKESLRWNPVAPFGMCMGGLAIYCLIILLGIPHRLTVDDIYEGKFMPAGAIVMGNIWYWL